MEVISDENFSKGVDAIESWADRNPRLATAAFTAAVATIVSGYLAHQFAGEYGGFMGGLGNAAYLIPVTTGVITSLGAVETLFPSLMGNPTP